MTVARAEKEARKLGHGQVGTEHLLLALVAAEGSRAGRTLRQAGATLGGCRTKVREVVGPVDTGGTPDLALTSRATRALERAERLSVRRRDEEVEPDHILLSVLDVEGRASQVLRGLSVDVALLREAVLSALDATDERVIVHPVEDRHTEPRCRECGAGLEDRLSHRVLTSRGSDGTRRELVIAYCSNCGAAVAATEPPPTEPASRSGG